MEKVQQRTTRIKDLSRVMQTHTDRMLANVKDPFDYFAPSDDPPFGATLVSPVGHRIRVFVGSVSDAMYKPALTEKCVTSVINCAESQCCMISKLEARNGGDSQWTRIQFHENWYSPIKFRSTDMEDNARFDLSPHLTELIEYIDSHDDGETILVHCIQGHNRSVAVVVAWLIRSCGMTIEEAVESVASRRAEVLSNKSFLSQLINFSEPQPTQPPLPPQAERRRVFTIGDIVER